MLDTAGDSSQAAHTGLAHVGLAEVRYDRNELQRPRLLAAGKSNQRIARLGAAKPHQGRRAGRELGLIP